MSHECPECGQICYCGGDIDDCCNNFEKDVMNCTHYRICEHYSQDEDGAEYYDDLADAEAEQKAELAEKLSEIPEARGVVIQSKEKPE